jgi:hypothetical protein
VGVDTTPVERHQAVLDMRQMLPAASGSRSTTVVSEKLMGIISLWSGFHYRAVQRLTKRGQNALDIRVARFGHGDGLI